MSSSISVVSDAHSCVERLVVRSEVLCLCCAIPGWLGIIWLGACWCSIDTLLPKFADGIATFEITDWRCINWSYISGQIVGGRIKHELESKASRICMPRQNSSMSKASRLLKSISSLYVKGQVVTEPLIYIVSTYKICARYRCEMLNRDIKISRICSPG